MQRIKIDYGIDLGTTNSAICRMEKGKPTIIKSDVQKDTMPSCVSINRKQSFRVGDTAYSQLKSDKRRANKDNPTDTNTFIEFKRSMGTDKQYHSSNAGKAFSPEELSAEVLKTLCSFVQDENVTSAVVTVPAKFTANQNNATMNAAKLAGITHCVLLQEPIAAAMAYGLKAEQKDAIWMVFDFGGGTFDAALIKVEDGIIQVFDTEGDNYLGGKNLDEAIVSKILIPHLQENFVIDSKLNNQSSKEALLEALKTYAEEAKNQLSFSDEYDVLSNLGELGEDDDGDELEIDVTITHEELHNAIRPLFQKAVTISLDLLKRNQLTGDSLDSLILVGGPTHSPILRKMLKEQITSNIDVSVDPMTAVATGAALYASTIDNVINESKIAKETLKLDISFGATTVELQEWLTFKLKEKHNEPLKVEISRADGGWASGQKNLDHNGDVVELQLREARPNSFLITVYNQEGNRLEAFPREFTIIQGSKVGAATLPYDIGIAINDYEKEKVVLTSFEGLERNKPLPATGTPRNGREFTTNSDVRPGISTDVIRIPIYQGDEGAEGKPAALYEWVADVVITGDDVNQLLPKETTVELTIKVDISQMMTVEAYFPQYDITINKDVPADKKQSLDEAKTQTTEGLKEARRAIRKLKNSGIDTQQLEAEIALVKEEQERGNDPKAALQHMKEVLRKVEELDADTEWERLEKALRSAFAKLEDVQRKENSPEVDAIVEELKRHTDEAIRRQNVPLGKSVLEDIKGAYFKLTLTERLTEIILVFYHHFDKHNWKNTARARQLVNRAMQLLATDYTVNDLRDIVREIFEALDEDEQSHSGISLNSDLLS